MLLILPSGGKLVIKDQVSGRIDYARLFGIRAVSLCCSFIWHPGGKFMLLIRPPGGKFMLLVLPSGGKLIIQDQVSERIAYAPLFGLRAVSLCFSFCLRAGSSFYKIKCPNG